MDWISLIVVPIINVLLAKCLPKRTTQTPQEYLRSQYDAKTKTFDEGVVRDTVAVVKKSIAKAKRKMTRAERKSVSTPDASEIRQIAIARLTAAMKAPASTTAQWMAVAAHFDENGEAV